MTRITSIGMGRKTFVASAAEESQKPAADVPVAGPSNFQKGKDKKDKKDKKRPRDEAAGGGGWKRDPAIAKETRDNAIKSAERRINRQNLNTTSTTCFACRNVGHAARDCPNVLLAAQGISKDGTAALLEGEGEGGDGKSANKGMKRGKGRSGGEVTGGGKCYRCNSNQHSLGNCPQKADFANPTPYATCFICLATGHLSALCPSNTKGVYVKGGSCKVCGSVQHRANDCPDDKREKRRKFNDDDAPAAPVNPADVGADEDDFMIKAQAEIKAAAAAARAKEEAKGKKKKHPPNNNGPREKYRKIEGEEGGAADLLADGAPQQQPKREAVEIERQAPVSIEAATPDQPLPVLAAAPAPVKRSKPKVVKF